MTELKRLELYGAIAVVLLIIGIVAWHEHNVNVANEALLKEHQKETQAEIAKIQADSAVLVAQANKENADKIGLLIQQQTQLIAVMNNLQKQMNDIRTAEQEQLAKVNTMSFGDLAAQLRQQLGPVQGPTEMMPVSRSDLVTVDGWKIKLDSCTAQSTIKDQSLSACAERVKKSEEALAISQDSVAKLNSALENEKQIEAKKDAQYKEDLKVVKGNWLKRLWNKSKFYIGIGLGGILARAI